MNSVDKQDKNKQTRCFPIILFLITVSVFLSFINHSPFNPDISSRISHSGFSTNRTHGFRVYSHCIITNVKTIFFDVFFLIFGGHMSFLWGHWYPCFGLLVMSALGFKARVESLARFLAFLLCLWPVDVKVTSWTCKK